MLFSKFHLEVVENDDQTLLELDFYHFFAGNESTFSDISGTRSKLVKTMCQFFYKVIIESSRPSVLSADFTFLRN